MSQMNPDDVIAQLRAEIAAYHPSQKAFADEVGVDYFSLRRHLSGERKMPLAVLFDCLRALKLDPVSFFVRVQQRADQREANDADAAGRRIR